MTDSSQAKTEIGEALIRLNNAAYLNEYIKEPLEQTIAPLLAGEKLPYPESIDTVILLIFTRIDLLGHLYKGRTSSKNAVEFMREYLGKVDERYKEVSGLLYHALRHGIVHLATPKRIKLQGEMILDFMFSAGNQRQEHLKVKRHTEIQSTGERIDIYRLSLDLHLLYKDLLSAMDTYAEDIRHNQEISEVFWKSFKTRRSPEEGKEESLLKKNYIKESDFAFVRKQISRL